MCWCSPATPIPRTLVPYLLWRHGCVAYCARSRPPPADSTPPRRGGRSGASTMSFRRSGVRWSAASGSIGCARWSRIRVSDLKRPSSATRPAAAFRGGHRSGAWPTEGPDQDAAMARFAAGETRLLVATTVIEVGVDVPEATVMVIEHAERSGCAHSSVARTCRARQRALDCPAALPCAARRNRQARIEILRETETASASPTEDLRLRGEGDVLGTRQSGMRGPSLASRCTARAGAGAQGRATDPVARRYAHLASRRGAAPPAVSVRARRGDPIATGGLATPPRRSPARACGARCFGHRGELLCCSRATAARLDHAALIEASRHPRPRRRARSRRAAERRRKSGGRVRRAWHERRDVLVLRWQSGVMSAPGGSRGIPATTCRAPETPPVPTVRNEEPDFENSVSNTCFSPR